jgi:hypothetical protein
MPRGQFFSPVVPVFVLSAGPAAMLGAAAAEEGSQSRLLRRNSLGRSDHTVWLSTVVARGVAMIRQLATILSFGGITKVHRYSKTTWVPLRFSKIRVRVYSASWPAPTDISGALNQIRDALVESQRWASIRNSSRPGSKPLPITSGTDGALCFTESGTERNWAHINDRRRHREYRTDDLVPGVWHQFGPRRLPLPRTERLPHWQSDCLSRHLQVDYRPV